MLISANRKKVLSRRFINSEHHYFKAQNLSVKNGENNGVLAGVPFLSPSRAPRALAPKFPLPFSLLTPATQAMVSSTDRSVMATRGNSTKFFDRGYLQVFSLFKTLPGCRAYNHGVF